MPDEWIPRMSGGEYLPGIYKQKKPKLLDKPPFQSKLEAHGIFQIGYILTQVSLRHLTKSKQSELYNWPWVSFACTHLRNREVNENKGNRDDWIRPFVNLQQKLNTVSVKTIRTGVAMSAM